MSVDIQLKIATCDYKSKVPYSKATRAEYRADTRRLINEFRVDLENEFGLTNHPKAELLFEKAWDRGHAGGFQEVYHHYDDLSELLTQDD
ncbi:unnamed protein product [Sphagnum tenellum]